jgi:hypothetical protein
MVGKMKDNKRINKKSNEIIKGNCISDTSQVLGNHCPNPTPIHNYGPLDFTVNQEFIEENKKINLNLVRHRQNSRLKFAPFTRSQRRKRRTEVYKLHFEHGIPATRIAEMMNVDRNTINNDLKILYREALADYTPEDMSLDDILQKQLVRLETQRDRLGIYLADAKDVNAKLSVERLIADIDFKLFAAIEKINHNTSRFWDEILKGVNKVAEVKKLDMRYTSLFELRKISIESRKSLNQIKKEALKEKKGRVKGIA